MSGIKCHLCVGKDKLRCEEDGVFLKWEDQTFRIGYIHGLSSPEVFMNKPELLDKIIEGSVSCPSLIDNIVGLANKGVFCILTDMREGRLDPSLLNLSKEDLIEDSPIPNTYWLHEVTDQNDYSNLFLARKMVAKPGEGVGGRGIIFSSDSEQLESFDLAQKKQYMIQDYYPSFQVDEPANMHASLDPYFTHDGEGQIVGVLVRSARHGHLPNLTYNSKVEHTGENQEPMNLFSLGVYNR